jgi:DNA helicase II / ATP-dependent DNA helicase PcrA
LAPGRDATLQALLKNTRALGASEHVHGISQARLDAEGRDPTQALTELRRFIGDTPVAGHNVGFDLAMLEAAGRRHGVDMHFVRAWDSLDVARRLVRADRYTLSHLVQHLGIPLTPTHRALDDVLATVALGERLARLAEGHAAERRAAMQRHAPRFQRLRQTLDRWATEALRPPALVQRIVGDALRHKYPSEPRRLDHLAELVRRLQSFDDPSLPPSAALSKTLTRAALVRDVDQLDQANGVRVLTMHQSKGLEFDRVWLPSMVDGTLPSWQSLRDGSDEALDEERRVLYVAATRARTSLHLSWAARGGRRNHTPSCFLDSLRPLLDCHEPQS